MTEYNSPQMTPSTDRKSIFLAGTIDIGNSEDWQENLIKILRKNYQDDIDIYNPRRKDWDSSWKQDFEDPQFFQQVTWEINQMNKADAIIVNFLPNSKSPITLLELGMYKDSKKLWVCCPDEFYRAGNVRIVCDYFDIPCFKTMGELLKNLQL